MSGDIYTSSITSRYGDVFKVKEDSKVLREIMARQGVALLIDVIAEYVGGMALGESDFKRLRDGLVKDFKNALEERT